MRFAKFQGAGNDFIIINNIEEQIPVERLGMLAQKLCRRRLSIGADGLMAVERPLREGDFRMLFYNADGSQGEMCGNGARCIARYGYEKGLAGETQRIETTAGMVVGRRIDRRTYRIRLNDPSVIRLDQTIEVKGEEGAEDAAYDCAYLELGDPGIPHAVVEMPEFWLMEEQDLRSLGKAIRHDKGFPKGANVNFFAQIGQDLIKEITYERGVEDFTLACGTGTGCVVAALTLQGRVSGKDVRVHTPGGELRITVTGVEDQGRITGLYLTGPTNFVAEGEILDEDFSWD